MSDETIIEYPGFRGRITGKLGDMMVIDAEVEADIPSHAAEAEEFAIVVSGRFEVTMNGTTTLCGPGDHLVVDAGMEHAIRVIEPGRLVLIGRM
jgi:quercetin dioxygenase-like cupin family protein